MATVHMLPRVVPAGREEPAGMILKKRKIDMNFDLLAQLAHTAHVMEASPDNAQQQQAQQPAASQGQSLTLISDLAALSGDTRAAKSVLGRGSESGRGIEAHAKQSKHKQAEQRRRERINDRLAALRELVPHDTRSNTATFLEGVISYIQSLQQSNVTLETQLTALQSQAAEVSQQQQHSQQQQAALATSGSPPASLAAASGTTMDEVMQQANLAAQLAQPCLSGVGAGAAAAGIPPNADVYDTLATVPAVTAATSFSSARPNTPHPSSELLPAMLSAAGTGCRSDGLSLAAFLQHHQHQVQQGQGSPTAVAAQGYPFGAATVDSQTKASTLVAAAPQAVASSPAPATPTAAEAVAASTAMQPTSIQLPPAPPLQLQPDQLQSVLEKALLTALQQQAQALAAQLSKG